MDTFGDQYQFNTYLADNPLHKYGVEQIQVGDDQIDKSSQKKSITPDSLLRPSVDNTAKVKQDMSQTPTQNNSVATKTRSRQSILSFK